MSSAAQNPDPRVVWEVTWAGRKTGVTTVPLSAEPDA
jgi:hypothetical protein